MLKSMFRGLLQTAPQAAKGSMVAAQPDNEFLDQLMQRFFASLGKPQTDNFDYERFAITPGTEVGPDTARNYRGFRFVHDNARQLERVRDLFEDQASRSLYEDLLLYRMLGHTYVRLPANTPQHWALREQAHSYKRAPGQYGGAWGEMYYFNLEFLGQPIDVQCWPGNIAWSFLLKQYYFDRDGVKIEAQPGDYVIDAGACFGDTALGFAAAAGAEGRVYAFDIMPLHMQIIRANLAANPALAGRIEVTEAALADRSDQALYIHGEGPSALVNDKPSERKVQVATIDEFAEERRLPRIDFIKMDIEGAELDALRGAEQTLRRWRPKLAISLYHQPTDIFEIPLYIERLGLGYAYYLEHYTIHNEETVLFAVPRR
jgi:FkbM family methyltransferase